MGLNCAVSVQGGEGDSFGARHFRCLPPKRDWQYLHGISRILDEKCYGSV